MKRRLIFESGRRIDLAMVSLLAISVHPSDATVELLEGNVMRSGVRVVLELVSVLEKDSLLPVNLICGRG